LRNLKDGRRESKRKEKGEGEEKGRGRGLQKMGGERVGGKKKVGRRRGR
jgi:hypothetical protein